METISALRKLKWICCYKKYLAMTPDPMVTREGLKEWYDGYSTKYGERVYNPRSVVSALINNDVGLIGWEPSVPLQHIE